jgi:type I restriction enzyme S subunit
MEEQRAIASFLERGTAKLDALIAKKERLIELLEEERTALISHAITRGLRPNVPMKASGIEWLGEIPAHWGIQQGRYLYRALDLPPRDDDGVVTAYRDGQVTLRENRRAEGYTFAIQEVGYQRVRAGDLVIQGMDAFAGAIGVSDSTGKCSPEYLVLEPLSPGTGNRDNRYYAAVLRLMAKRGYILVICNAVRERAPRFRLPEFRTVLLPQPPEPEQRSIADYLDYATAKIDRLRGKVHQAIDRLREYRTALISAAVTGKIDIRGGAA